jgi:hypothetical protein
VTSATGGLSRTRREDGSPSTTRCCQRTAGGLHQELSCRTHEPASLARKIACGRSATRLGEDQTGVLLAVCVQGKGWQSVKAVIGLLATG